MASASGANAAESNTSANVVPQWKKDLIQRRRQQQNKIIINNIASTKLCPSIIDDNGLVPDDLNIMKTIENNGVKYELADGNKSPMSKIENAAVVGSDLVDDCTASSASYTATTTTRESSSSSSSSSSSTFTSIIKDKPPLQTITTGSESVACKMRFEADVPVCPSSEDNNTKTSSSSLIKTLTNNNTTERNNSQDYTKFDSDYNSGDNNDDDKNLLIKNKSIKIDNNKKKDTDGLCVYAEFKKGRDKTEATNKKMDNNLQSQINNHHNIVIDDRNKKYNNNNNKSIIKNGNDDGESDSSEELQYGPGIVNRLKSKYLNLTLRETNNKNRTSKVQCFRRAASLEDLLDCDDNDENEKLPRNNNINNNSSNNNNSKYIKKSLNVKTERYRNTVRGNDTMKRARSVEALMRCQSNEDTTINNSRFIGIRQEPVNDHIVLIDRTTVKIESRLTTCGIIDAERPKALNKPKRIKPLLAETERPPTDLVKTTMRIFEGSVKRLKPKGDVAAKVATFKTINDTFKAQSGKKITPKPPIQPKPLTNGNIKQQPNSPKKNPAPQPPKQPITAELIENPVILEEYRNDGVVTDPIVQSVSSVVSKFQQIGKTTTTTTSPSSSPEPIYNKLKAASPSPEPAAGVKQKINNDPGSIVVKTLLSPSSSPKKDKLLLLSSPKKEESSHDVFRNNLMQDNFVTAQPGILVDDEEYFIEADDNKQQPENRRQQVPEQKISPPIEIDDKVVGVESNNEIIINKEDVIVEKEEEEEKIVSEDNFEHAVEDSETIDGPKTISKTALDSIGKAGSTMEFNFNSDSSPKKSYLPGTIQQNGNTKKQNGTHDVVEKIDDGDDELSNDLPGNYDGLGKNIDDNNIPIIIDNNLKIDKTINEITTKADVEIIKPIGAISSLGLIKSSSTTTTASSYQSLNDTKLIKNQKIDLSSPPAQKQIGIIRPIITTKTQLSQQQNLSSRELEKNLINRVKSIEQPTKVVVSLRSSADEIQPVKKIVSSNSGSGSGGGGGLWDTKPWNQQNNTMVFNFSNRKDVPDYIENDGLIISRKREKSKVGDGGIIVLDATLDASTTDDNDWENSEEPPSPCDIIFTNDNVLINGRSNLSRTPRNHKHRIHFNDQATRTFEYPSESSMLEDTTCSSSCVDGETSVSGDRQQQQSTQIVNKSISPTVNSTSPILGGGGLASFTPSKVDLASEGFELGVTRSMGTTLTSQSTSIRTDDDDKNNVSNEATMNEDEDCLLNSQDTAAWGAEATADLLY